MRRWYLILDICISVSVLVVHGLAQQVVGINIDTVTRMHNERQLQDTIYIRLGKTSDFWVQLQTVNRSTGGTRHETDPYSSYVGKDPVSAPLWALSDAWRTEALFGNDSNSNIDERKTHSIPFGSIAAVVDAQDVGPMLATDGFPAKFFGNDTKLACLLILSSNKAPYGFGWNFGSTSPLSGFQNSTYHWNPKGLGLVEKSFGFPIVQLDSEGSRLAQDGCKHNAMAIKKNNAPIFHAAVQYQMLAQENSSSCIAHDTCLPLGGYSIVSHMNAARKEMEAILVVSGMDSIGPFHKQLNGFDSPRSGLVALLLIAKILGQHKPRSGWRKNIVFAAIQGDSFDLMGTRSLLYDMDTNEWLKNIMPIDKISAVVDINGIGNAEMERNEEAGAIFKIFAHHNGKSKGSLSSSGIVELLEASSRKHSSPILNVSLSDMGPREELPPSSALGILRRSSSTPVVIISEDSTEFVRNGVFSRFGEYIPDERSVPREAVHVLAHTAISVAETLCSLAADECNLDHKIESNIREEAEKLTDCMLSADTDMCFYSNLIPIGAPYSVDELRNSYVGILPYVTSVYPPSINIRLMSTPERFVWNYLQQAIALPQDKLKIVCSSGNQTDCPTGTQCSGFSENMPFAKCLPNSTFFIPAYSRSLQFAKDSSSKIYRWTITNVTSSWDSRWNMPPDPIWTESNWPPGTPNLFIYLQESNQTQNSVFFMGLVALVVSICVHALMMQVHARKL